MNRSVLLDETGRMLVVAGIICIVLLVPMMSVGGRVFCVLSDAGDPKQEAPSIPGLDVVTVE